MSGGFLTPVAAVTQATAQGWLWCYYTLAITQTILAVVFLFGYKETKYIRALDGSPERHIASLQQHKMEILSNENEDDQGAPTEPEIVNTLSREPTIAKNTYFQNMRFATSTSESLWRLFIAPASVILLPHVLFAAIQYASAVCWLVFYSATSPIVFSAPPHQFTASGLGNMLLGPLVGSILGSVYSGLLSDRVVVFLAQRNGGLFEPEMRLRLLPPIILAIAGGLITYGTTAARGLHWIYPSIGGALYGFGFSALSNIVFTMVIDTYYEQRLSFAVAFLRNALSIAMPFTVNPWLRDMGMSNMFIILGCLAFAIGMTFLPLILFGKRIRAALAGRYYKLVEKQRYY